MKILVLSDSHQHSMDHIFSASYDAIIHCGDYGPSKELLTSYRAYFVRGNCDLDGVKHWVGELFSRKILITHGDLEEVKTHRDFLLRLALELKAEVVFFGHTHRQEVFESSGILFVNPGAYPDYVEITDYEMVLYHQGQRKKMKYKW